ncbi:MAG: TrbC/VirB2 family protein [Methylotenera sp.]|nr:TrbC/VirB2 family protein [Methylotenera sp.]MDD4926847.1 TrbC/VirB2 family protein [Methylotenera sp.]NOU40414.1 TrbC/VirB2 family protein [Methylotenera sp.]
MIKKTQGALSIKPFHSSSMSTLEQQKQNQNLMKFAFATAICCIVLDPTIAAATTSLEDAATNILTALTGGLGKTIATLAVIVLGFMAMFGKLAWDNAIKVIVGITLVFGAATVIKWIAPTMGGVLP